MVTQNDGLHRSVQPLVVVVTVLLVSYGTTSSTARAQPERSSTEGEQALKPPPNLVSPTFGGTQVWSDEHVFHAYRIQRNVLTGHYRLLDRRQFRQAWGTYRECLNRLNEVKREDRLEPMKGKVVIVLHGIIRSRTSMKGLSRYLKEKGDFTVINMSYASTREKIADHAATLGRVIQRLDRVEEIHFVAHSMGNLVIRHYLGDVKDPRKSGRPDPRLGRMVMLAPPNNGTRMAKTFKDNQIYRLLWGVSGREMAENWPMLQAKLATPTFEFGIIAGDIALYDRVRNPIFDEKNDLVVSVEETRLIGASDFTVLPVLHSSIMDDEKVREYTLRFLEHGYFVSPAKREPVKSIEYQASKDDDDH